MRTWIRFLALALLMPNFGYAITVTYATSTDPADQMCPANSFLQNMMCYCISGYKVSGTQCVKDEAMPAGTYEIYVDIAIAVSNNEDPPLTCEQLGATSAIEKDMCTRYKATPADKRSQWTPVPRPSTNTVMITNPWAPASQQSLNMFATTSQAIPAKLPPPPVPPPPPPPPPTEELPPPPPPAPAVATDTNDLAKKALAETKLSKYDENLAALENNAELAPLKAEAAPPPEPPPQAVYSVAADMPYPQIVTQQSFPQIAAVGAAQNGVNITPSTPGLTPLTLSDADKITSVENMPPEKVQEPPLFARVFGWLFSWW